MEMTNPLMNLALPVTRVVSKILLKAIGRRVISYPVALNSGSES